MDSEENKLSDLESRKRDHKIYITKEAIAKVPFIKYESIDKKFYDVIQGLAKEVLRISKEQNDSNEVSIIYSLDWERLQAKGKEYFGISIGDEHSVNPEESTVAYHLVNSSLSCIVICMHNHPNLSKLSLNDVNFFLRKANIKMMAAVTNLGSISYIVKTDKYDWDVASDIYDEAISLHNINPGDIKNAQNAANYFLKNCYKANVVYRYK